MWRQVSDKVKPSTVGLARSAVGRALAPAQRPHGPGSPGRASWPGLGGGLMPGWGLSSPLLHIHSTASTWVRPGRGMLLLGGISGIGAMPRSGPSSLIWAVAGVMSEDHLREVPGECISPPKNASGP